MIAIVFLSCSNCTSQESNCVRETVRENSEILQNVEGLAQRVHAAENQLLADAMATCSATVLQNAIYIRDLFRVARIQRRFFGRSLRAETGVKIGFSLSCL
jgi:hypothetical protein